MDTMCPYTTLFRSGMTDYVTADAAYHHAEAGNARNGAIKLHGPEGFEGMRAAGRLAAEILDALVPHIVPGVTTGELDAIVYRMMRDAGAVPATLGYRGYTHSSCISDRKSTRLNSSH